MHIAVVGAGVIGLLCAHHLARRGARVTVVDRDQPGSGCSAGNAGWVTPSISNPLPAPGLRAKSLLWMLHADSPLYIRPRAVPSMLPFLANFWRCCTRRDFERGTYALARLNERTMELFDQLREDGVDFESHPDGLLMVFGRQRQLEHELAALERIDYGPFERLGADEVRQREPALAATPSAEICGGLHVLPERTVRPESLCTAVAEALLGAGVEIHSQVDVTGLLCEAETSRALVTDNGLIEADAFLIATGAEASRLTSSVGSPLPIQAGKGYSSTVEDTPVELIHSLYLDSAKIGVSPFSRGIRVAGTMELSGINRYLDPRRLAAVERGAERLLPRLYERRRGTPWVGMRPLTPDGLPILGRLKRRANVYVATGHQMLGVTLAPSTGRAMAQLILEGRSDVDLGAFDPRRFN